MPSLEKKNKTNVRKHKDILVTTERKYDTT